MLSGTINQQARRLYGVFSEMLRRCQFRDREQICCHGLSVSQCYALEVLCQGESMTMGDLSGRLCLKISSVTRVVDGLVESGLVRRVDNPADRRVCLIQVTAKGRSLIEKIHRGLIHEYEQVLRNVPEGSREAVIQAVSELLAAFEKRCGAEAGAGCCEET